MRAAYDALPDATRTAIDPLIIEHDIFWSRGQIGFTDFAPGERAKYPPSPQRLVRRHPGSGRKALYLSAHASHVVGWPVADGRLLLLDLNTHATQRQRSAATRRAASLWQSAVVSSGTSSIDCPFLRPCASSDATIWGLCTT